MSELNYSLLLSEADAFQRNISQQTKKVYDYLSGVYPVSSYFFHSKAHKVALQMAGVSDGMRVLEVATGSGEMFRRLIRANPTGATVGLDLSPNMAARSQEDGRAKSFLRPAPAVRRWMPGTSLFGMRRSMP